jgi:hypothetical protein
MLPNETTGRGSDTVLQGEVIDTHIPSRRC